MIRTERVSVAEIELPAGTSGQSLDATRITRRPARLQERAHLGKLALRLRPQAYPQAERTVGVPLPAAGHVSQSAELTALFISPAEFLLVARLAGLDELAARLASALGGQEAALVDVSSNFAVFRLSGPRAASVLARGCSVELEPPAFNAGCCATTKIGRITTLIHRVNEEPSFDVYVGRSFSASLLSWFAGFAELEELPSA